LVELAQQVLAVAVVTGRPARQALDLGGLEAVGNAVGDAGKELYLFGQYGNERWSSTNRRVSGPGPPDGLAAFIAELPRRSPRWPRRVCPPCWSAPPPTRRALWSPAPTSWCTAPRACSSCSASSPRTPPPCAPDATRRYC